MQLTVNKTTLANAIAAVGKVIENRNTIPVLSNVLLSADKGRLHLTATDLDIVAKTDVEADITAEGALCVEAKLLGDIARKASGDVMLATEGDTLTVKSGRSRFKLAVLPADDFPQFPAATFEAEFETDLAALYSAVSFAISSEEVRYFLNGIFTHVVDGRLCAVATDGHRLARNYGIDVVEFAGVIVPRKVVSVMPKGNVKVSVSPSRIRIVAPDMEITSKVIDGTFPDYPRVIPASNDIVAIVGRDEILSAAARVVTISSERGRSVKLSFAPGMLALSARSEANEATDEVAADFTQAPFETGVNSQYLHDMLGVMPAGNVIFKMADGGSPILVRGENDSWDGVLMPMRVL